MLLYLAGVNVLVAVFNMLPVFPLDGGRVLRAALWHRGGNFAAATRTAAGVGRFFAFVLSRWRDLARSATTSRLTSPSASSPRGDSLAPETAVAENVAAAEQDEGAGAHDRC